jgi:HK97 gp10 family phage protein
MSVSVRVTDEPDWQARLEQGERSLAQVKEMAARETVRLAKHKAPVDTGRLQSSIRAELVQGGDWLVGTNVHYARDQEFGTLMHPGQPYLRPAKDEVQAKVDNMLRSLGVFGVRGLGGGL